MLLSLQIKNLALIESSELRADSGLTVITGETGAGKSLLMTAIKALTGLRLGKEMIRQGEESALIEAVFSVEDLSLPGTMKEELYPSGEDTEEVLVLSREIRREGRSLCRVNGRVVPLSYLQELGSCLAEIHGQHESQTIFDPRRHLPLLDRYARDTLDPLFKRYQVIYKKTAELRKKARHLVADPRERERLMKRIRKQLTMFEKLALREGEEDELIEEREKLGILEQEMSALYRAERLISGDPESSAEGLESGLRRLAQCCEELEELEEESCCREESELLCRLGEDLESLRRLLEKRGREKEFHPERIGEIERRLERIEKAKRYFNMDFDALFAYGRRLEEKAKALDDRIPETEALLEEKKEAERALLAARDALRRERLAAGERLSHAIERELEDLGMSEARFICSFSEKKMDAGGADQLQFLFSANPGEAPLPLSRIASGGEASRIMLAVKVILAQADQTPFLVFDEIDQGISGEAALRVGQKLTRLAAHHQVFCVSHQAQLAALAKQVYRIQKVAKGERSVSCLQKLDEEGRIRELARLLASGQSEESSRRLALELLEAGAQYRARAETDI